MFTSGTRITVPAIVFASSVWINRSTAMIDAYSVPCAPETMASTGPGLAPCTTATGIDSAASLPAGTSIAPNAVCPRDALAVPTVNVAAAPAPPLCAPADAAAPAAVAPAVLATRHTITALTTRFMGRSLAAED